MLHPPPIWQIARPDQVALSAVVADGAGEQIAASEQPIPETSRDISDNRLKDAFERYSLNDYVQGVF